MDTVPSAVDADRIRLLIFDLDGTIADTIESIREGVNMAMIKYDFPERSYEEIRSFIGNGARELIRRSMPDEASSDPELVSAVFADYDYFYGLTYDHCERCYDGIPEALATLKERGYTIAVLSNKQDNYVKALVDLLIPEGIVSLAAGQTSLPKKPDPTVPLMMAEQLGFLPQETAFVGDSDVDILTAHNAGMLSVGVSWGYRGRQILEDSGAQVIIDHAHGLADLFLGVK